MCISARLKAGKVKLGALLQVASEILEFLLDESDEVVEVRYSC